VATRDIPAGIPLTSVQPDDYPRLSREGLGALKFNWRKANVKDDWTKGGSLSDAWDRVTGWPYWKKPSYDLDYGMRVLAKIAQEIPAWREVVGESAGLLVSRMPQYAAWFDWVEEVGHDPNQRHYSYLQYRSLIPPGFAGVYNSPGYIGNGLNTHLDQIEASLMLATRRTPRAEHPYYPQHSPAVGRRFDPDPIYANGSSNMMYKGYFAHQLMLGYVMTGNDKFLEPQHLVYDDEIQYDYSVTDIVRIMCEQHLGDVDENGSPLLPGIDCEVGKMFPVCVSVGGLAAHLHDEVFGTRYRQGYDRWLGWAKDNIAGGNTEPDGGFAWCAPYYDRDIPYCMSEPYQQLGPFFIGPAMQLLPVEPAFATRIYEGMIKNFGRVDDDGLHIVWPPAVVGTDDRIDPASTSGALTYAREIGDVERAEALEQWMNTHGGATYDNGEFYFTYGLEEEWPRGIPNAWATLGYIGGAGSLRRTYNELNLEKFSQPTLEGVDYPGVNVSQASYDAAKDALIVTISPGSARVGSITTFRVTHYPYGERGHQVLMDGKEHDDWSDAGPGEIVVRATVDDHTLVIR
jgi:Linalool dehydratase/isomerase